jgi:S-adenosylmethionine:tRNA-ribosyltransferase-isomerase (queuine synthetase)
MQSVTKQFMLKKEGAVAAPTAGLHFSKHLLKKLEIKESNLTLTRWFGNIQSC